MAETTTLFLSGRRDGINLSGVGGETSIDLVTGDRTLEGSRGDDVLFRDAADDTIAGGEGDDVIYAGAGNDTLTGGTGHDTLMAALATTRSCFTGVTDTTRSPIAALS